MTRLTRAATTVRDRCVWVFALLQRSPERGQLAISHLRAPLAIPLGNEGSLGCDVDSTCLGAIGWWTHQRVFVVAAEIDQASYQPRLLRDPLPNSPEAVWPVSSQSDNTTHLPAAALTGMRGLANSSLNR